MSTPEVDNSQPGSTSTSFVGTTKFSMGSAGELIIVGSVNILGDLSVDGDFNVKGAITGKDLTVEKINVSTPEVDIGQPSAASIGNETLAEGETEVVVETTAVTADSQIFITPTVATDKVLSVTSKVEGESFTVTVTSSVTNDIRFSWWVVN